MKEEWPGGAFVAFCILAFLVPIVGWIMGGINLNKDNNTQARIGQAQILLVIATVSFGIGMLILMA